ncbi:hypothetical protein F1880_000397 [Penicillium rolfsii]|nr:hypothetical protein F1880_000397 [Penicillium rolfsii]
MDNDYDFFNPHYSRLNILRLSSQIREECLDLLYGENLFDVSWNGDGEGDLQATSNTTLIRKTDVISDIHDDVSSTPKTSLWASLLPNLKVFQIIAKQPVEARAYWNAPTLEQEFNGGIKWATAYFDCFRRYLSTKTKVKLDDDNREETRFLADRYLPLTYQRSRYLCGDLIFRRGQYSVESGY